MVGHGPLNEADQEQAQATDFVELVKNHNRRIPVPRRMVRLLSREGTRLLIATVFGHLLRCLYYRQGQCRPSGMCKATWIAEVFGVDVRNVKSARKELVQRGILTMEHRPQWFWNRYGPVARVNLAWGTGMIADRRLPPPSGAICRESPPPTRKHELLRIRNQKPSGTVAGACNAERTVAPPDLRHVVPSDLSHPGRLMILHEQACGAGFVNGSEGDRLKFFAAAEHAQNVATRNPAGLFAATVRSQRWSYLTLADEDSARRKLNSVRLRPATGLMWPGADAPIRVGDLALGLMKNLQRQSGPGVRPALW